MYEISLAALVDDADGSSLAPVAALWPQLGDHFGAVAVQLTPQTDSCWRRFLESVGVPFAIAADADGRTASQGFAPALKLALATASARWLISMSLPNLCRWLQADAAAVERSLRWLQRCDCLVVGRTPEDLDALSGSRRVGERLTNALYRTITGQDWDVVPAVRGLSRATAELVLAESPDQAGLHPIAWPLLCDVNGLRVSYLPVAALPADGADPLGDEADHCIRETALAHERAQALSAYVGYYRQSAPPAMATPPAAATAACLPPPRQARTGS